ncbi:hypothetical protein BaRGS_00025643 [Batillaria attramentaria]|uniref:Uncharacterized protein n=1 Tax=Batillaria attramentaria TaxID=370345 RepID=A0ABD0K7H6_9CAEN
MFSINCPRADVPREAARPGYDTTDQHAPPQSQPCQLHCHEVSPLEPAATLCLERTKPPFLWARSQNAWLWNTHFFNAKSKGSKCFSIPRPFKLNRTAWN